MVAAILLVVSVVAFGQFALYYWRCASPKDEEATILARLRRGEKVEGTDMNVGTNRKRTDHIGSTFNSFLEQEGIREEAEAVAIERVLVWQLEQAMQEQQKTKRV